MFGLIYSLFVSMGLIGHTAKEIQENEENKVKYRHPDGLTYVDTKGRSRLVSTNEIVFFCWENDDYVLKKTNGTVIKNYTKIERDKKYKEYYEWALKEGKSTYCIDDDNRHGHIGECHGMKYKDFKTGDIYVIRYIKDTYWYLNVANGRLVRKTDAQIQRDKTALNAPAYINNPELYERFHFVDVQKLNSERKDPKDIFNYYLQAYTTLDLPMNGYQ